MRRISNSYSYKQKVTRRRRVMTQNYPDQCEGKFFPVLALKIYGGMEEQLYSFLTSVLYQVRRHHSLSASFGEKNIFLIPTGNRNMILRLCSH